MTGPDEDTGRTPDQVRRRLEITQLQERDTSNVLEIARVHARIDELERRLWMLALGSGAAGAGAAALAHHLLALG